MFDPFARDRFRDLPDLPGLDADGARRMLSHAYAAVLQLRVQSTFDMEELTRVTSYLRRLASTMEFYAVLEEDVDENIRRAGAFVTAESLGLLTDIYDQMKESEPQGTRIRHERVYSRIESAILYLIAQYDANAAGVIKGVMDPRDSEGSAGEQAAEWCLDILLRFCSLRLNPLPRRICPVSFAQTDDLDAVMMHDDTVGRLFGLLGEAVSHYMAWLAGERTQGADEALEMLGRLLDSLSPQESSAGLHHQGLGGDYAKVRHLAQLLIVCLPRLRDRSLIETVPPGPGFSGDQYSRYLQLRARGGSTSETGRPVLWPSAMAYVDNCILGDLRHAVVSMPTGSGKSFVAELAISQSVGEGWVLYLAPTNALTEQIRNDLRKSMVPLGTEVLAFVGDREYSVLSTEVVSKVPSNAVAVMTPEKASLAIRLYPEAFATCKLVVFDECHLIGETTSGRAVIAELLLSHIMLLAPETRILLMSAIVQNPEELADWLKEATGHTASTIMIPWRPTRTLRSALAVDHEALLSNRNTAASKLEQLPSRRKNINFLTPSSFLCGLQGAWQSTRDIDYGTVSVPYDATLTVTRRGTEGNWKYSLSDSGWVNRSAIGVASLLAERGIQTLAFIPANRHHPFSNAGRTKLSNECLNSLERPPSIIKVCQTLAEFEFGCSSIVFELLGAGISVHTSHMIETEKIASEAAFRNQASRLMYATGTLAQGLNLPATAVVIAGTHIGYDRNPTSEIVRQRQRAQLLNAAGRAGRAGFANQGLVVAIPDKPIIVDAPLSVDDARNDLTYLQYPDNAVEVKSGLDSFMDQVANDLLNTETASEIELQTIAALSGGDERQPHPLDVIRKTYASYRRKTIGKDDIDEVASLRLIQIRDEFVKQVESPDWVTVAAQRAGLDYFLTLSLFRSWKRIRPQLPEDVLDWTVADWTVELLRVVAHIPPSHLLRLMSVETISKASATLKRSAEFYSGLYVTNSEWQPSDEWVEGWERTLELLNPWMEGQPLVELAKILSSSDAIEPDRNSGSKPLPKAIALTNDLFSRLALLAGGLVAVAEQLFNSLHVEGNKAFESGVPLSLNVLPMCVKYGCDSPQSLAWYRFGIRLRRPSRLLYEAFRPPEGDDDEALRAWVRKQRSKWLDGEFDETQDIFIRHQETLDAIAEFIRQE